VWGRKGAFTTLTPSLVKMSLNTGGELGAAVPDEEPELADPAEEVHDQIAGLLSSPYSVWIVGPPRNALAGCPSP
jgi:hypothetical protein